MDEIMVYNENIIGKLLLNCCYRLQLDFMLCDHFLLRVFYVYA